MRQSRLGWYKQERLIEHFVTNTIARVSASLGGVNKTTITYYFHCLKILIYEATENNRMSCF